MAGPLAGVGAYQQPQITQTSVGQSNSGAGQVRQTVEADKQQAEQAVERSGQKVRENFESNNTDLKGAETDFSFNASQLAGDTPPRGSLVNVLT